VYTRCQGCHTVHPVNAALLARGGGRYRCGKCKKIGNALDALFDNWPEASQAPPAPGSLPELGAPLKLDPAGEQWATPEEAALLGEPEVPAETAQRAARRLLRVVGATAAVVIALVVALNVARYFDFQLLDRPALHSALERSGLKESPPEPPFRDLDAIEIVSRDMTDHPSRPAVLLLNATLINRAERAQPYPDIEVSLFDLDNRVLARQRFSPGEYLSRSAELRRGMIPDAYVGLSLEMLDPGDAAVGFELQFH
jgi:predicted Zn finger-like uncharacterized protein